MPFAIVPFNPADPQIANRPVLLEPADLLTVRRTYNFVWGEPLDDGLPLGDPNKRVGLVGVDTNNDGRPDLWRAVLRLTPATIYQAQIGNVAVPRVYREVRYRFWGQDRNGDGQVNSLDLQDFEFFFDPTQPGTLVLAAPVPRPIGERVLRVTYQSAANPVVPTILRELYLVPPNAGQLTLRENATKVLEVMEEFPLLPDDGSDRDGDGNPLDADEWRLIAQGVLEFNTPMPRPLSLSLNDPRLGALRVDYLVADPQLGDHWVVETGTTFDPDPSLRQKLNIPLQATVGIFRTTFGGIPVDPNTNRPIITAITLSPNRFGLPLFPAPVAPNPSPNGNSLPQEGLLVLGFDPPNTLPVPPNERMRVAYRAGDDLNTPVDESWFLQVIKPPDDFQLFTQADQQVLSTFPFEQLRWFTVSGNALQFNRLLAGLNVQVRYRNSANELFTEMQPIAGNGSVILNRTPARMEEVRGASLLVRVSGGSMWRQSPPKTRADYVELATIIPPKPTQP
jgi:catechol 2,3-dioxygenase-like lactoylglutathione lyase family enzyme